MRDHRPTATPDGGGGAVVPPPPSVTGQRRRFGARVRQLRERAGLSQERLAEVSGLDRKTISRTENGVHGLRLDHVFAIAVALDATPADLFTCEPADRHPPPAGADTCDHRPRSRPGRAPRRSAPGHSGC